MVTGKHVLRAKKKDKKPENNEVSEKKHGDNDVDEITGQTLVAGSNNNEEDDKNNDNIKKNKLINQKIKVGDGNNDKDGNNDDIALRTNRVQSVRNPENAPKRRFKIRRTVYVKVRKNN